MRLWQIVQHAVGSPEWLDQHAAQRQQQYCTAGTRRSLPTANCLGRPKSGVVPPACHLAQPVVCIAARSFSRSNQEVKQLVTPTKFRRETAHFALPTNDANERESITANRVAY